MQSKLYIYPVYSFHRALIHSKNDSVQTMEMKNEYSPYSELNSDAV